MDIINSSKKAKRGVNMERKLIRHYFNVVSAASSVKIEKDFKSTN
jgi:hypothetical protein